MYRYLQACLSVYATYVRSYDLELILTDFVLIQRSFSARKHYIVLQALTR